MKIIELLIRLMIACASFFFMVSSFMYMMLGDNDRGFSRIALGLILLGIHLIVYTLEKKK